jgi:thioredoxin reductase (NADPH)
MKENNGVAIIGGGPAGLTAALYLGRAHIPCVVFDENMCGGQIISSPLLENVPGFYGPGVDLAMNMLEEIAKYPSVQFANFTKVVKVEPISRDEQLLTLEDGDQIYFQYVICATGSTPIRLPQLESENTHYCVTCDGALYEGKTVAVIGGGNTALQYALELTKYAEKIYICTNEDSLRGEETMRERVLNEPKIEVRTNFTATALDGDVLEQAEGHSLMVDGIFVAIGYRTNTDYLDAVKVEGRFLTDLSFNVGTDEEDYDNIFAIGDCRYRPFNQVAIAMGEGCQAALYIIRDLEK